MSTKELGYPVVLRRPGPGTTITPDNYGEAAVLRRPTPSRNKHLGALIDGCDCKAHVGESAFRERPHWRLGGLLMTIQNSDGRPVRTRTGQQEVTSTKVLYESQLGAKLIELGKQNPPAIWRKG